MAAIGGLLARPAEGFPSFFSPDGLFGVYPYLLPNVVCSILLLFSILFSWLFLQETHPDWHSGDHDQQLNDDMAAERPLLVTAGATANAGADLRVESYGTFNQVQLHRDEDMVVYSDGSKSEGAPRKQTIFTWRVTMLIIALAIFTYHSMTFDHLLPIFLQDKNVTEISTLGTSPLSFPGGVGLSTSTVGLIMSTDGIIALFIQSVIFPTLASYLGVWKLFVMVTVLHPLTASNRFCRP